MAAYLSNALSLNMFDISKLGLIRVMKMSPEMIPDDVISCIGHADTARVIGKILGREIPVNRVSVKLNPRDSLYVAQYIGPRLTEGATELPPEAELNFFYVRYLTELCGDCRGSECSFCLVPWINGAD